MEITKFSFKGKTNVFVGTLFSIALFMGLSFNANGAQSKSNQAMLNLDGTAVIAAIASGKFSASDYVKAALSQIKARKNLNAMISVDEKGALAQAARIDQMRAQGKKLPPLAGLVIVVKDNINSKDLPTTAGTMSLANNRPTSNAPSLQKLLDAGAIMIGKANMHELAFGITSTNATQFPADSGLFGGEVANPYDVSRIAGGSSGGTAAAIAARMVPAGLGTDTGGSVRVPAALTGTAGFRPSVGNGGSERRYHDDNAVVPISHTRDTVGPMGRTVRDLALMDAVISGQAMPKAAKLKGLRFGMPSEMWDNIDPATAKVMESAKKKLIAAGVILVPMSLNSLHDYNNATSFVVALHEPVADLPGYLQANNSPVKTVKEVADNIASKDVQGAFGAIMGDVFGAKYDEAMKVHRPLLQSVFKDGFANNKIDALFYPTTPLPAIPMDKITGSGKTMLNSVEVDTFATFIRNVDPGTNAGIPSLSLPAGVTATGLPVGLTLEGLLGSDSRLLGIGMAVEAVIGSIPAPKN